MNRRRMFEAEEISGIRGLTSLTEPSSDESIGAVIDVAVIGARGDGKTQFIVHAIRTLRAYAPVLEGIEHRYNRDVLEVVMNAREPRPEATAPGVVPHYVFRIRPESLESQLGFVTRAQMWRRVGGLALYAALAVVNAAALLAGMVWWRGQFAVVDAVASGGLLLLGLALGCALARQRFLRSGEVEIVFWDVAGEHVYSDSAADYYEFLSALVRERRRRAGPRRGYAFAPVLMCNPIGLGMHVESSPYARLRQLIPLFASLNGAAPQAMVAINRWAAVGGICPPGANRHERVAVMPRVRRPRSNADAMEVSSDDLVTGDPFGEPAEALPVVAREVVRRHCLDAEDHDDREVHIVYLRYDAGSECEVTSRAWPGYDELEPAERDRWGPPLERCATDGGELAGLLDYLYEEGPRSFDKRPRRQFLRWLGQLAYEACVTHSASAEHLPADSGHEPSVRQQVHEAPEADPEEAAMGRLWASAVEPMDPWAEDGTAPGIGPGEAASFTGPAVDPMANQPPAPEQRDRSSSAAGELGSGGFRGGT